MAVLLSILLVSAAALLGHATWDPKLTQSLDSDLDDQLCQTETHSSTIIDIHESMERGAELMDGVRKDSLVECMSGCCATKGCDLALYKNHGLSKTGKNCYYVNCGAKENCVIVQHSAFTSVLFLPRSPYNRQGDVATSPAPTEEHSTSQSSPSTTSKLPVSSASTSHSETQPQTDSMSASEKSDGPATTHVAMTTNPLAEEDASKNATSANHTFSGGSAKKGGKGLAANEGQAVVPSEERPGSVEEDSDSCGQYGCDGSGIVAVVVVAVICFVIVVVVVGIMAKKAISERRKRKFRNVDYLINGMYT